MAFPCLYILEICPSGPTSPGSSKTSKWATNMPQGCLTWSHGMHGKDSPQNASDSASPSMQRIPGHRLFAACWCLHWLMAKTLQMQSHCGSYHGTTPVILQGLGASSRSQLAAVHSSEGAQPLEAPVQKPAPAAHAALRCRLAAALPHEMTALHTLKHTRWDGT